MNTEAEAHAVHAAGAVVVAEAIGVDVAEARRAAGIRGTEPPPVQIIRPTTLELNAVPTLLKNVQLRILWLKLM